MSSEALFVAEWVTPESLYRLSDAISAFEIDADKNGSERLGPVCTLPAGANLKACGEGFNERTLKVSCDERSYFVFLQDLHSQRR